MPAKFTLRPGVFFEWIDQGISPVAISTSIGAMVFPSDRGPLEPKAVSGGYTRFEDFYGKNNYLRGYGHDTAKGFFRTAEAAICLRVTGTGAKYGLAVVANNYTLGATTAANPSGLYADGTTVTSIPSGSTVDYTLINRDVVDIIFSNVDIAANQIFAVTINGVATTGVSFTGDSHANTMFAIAQSIQARLDALGTGGYAAVINKVNVPGSPRIIRVISPHNLDITVTGAAFTGSAAGSAPTVTVRDAEWLKFVLTENPGEWGKNIAVQFDGVDTGRAAKATLTFSGPFANNHRFSVLINGVTVSVAPNATGSNAMMDDIAAAIRAAVPNVNAVVNQVSGSNLNRVITITGANANVDLNITSQAVGFASGSTPALPGVTKNDIVTRLLPTSEFTMSVYEAPDLRTPRDVYRAAIRRALDAGGNQINLEYLVNNGSARSARVRIYVNPLAYQNNWTVRSNTLLNLYSGDGFLRGAENGLLATSSNIITGWDKLRDTTRYTVRILMDCGYSTPEVHRNMNTICEERRDCVAIFGVPSSSQGTIEDIKLYRTETLAIDSSYSTLYSTDVEIYDTEIGMYRFSPPSGYVGAVFAFTDRTRREFWSPAGLTRGRIPEASNVRARHENGDQSTMFGYQINPIINYKGQGIYIFGDWTLQYASSPMQFIGTRRMCNSIEVIAATTVAYSLFEPNNRATRNAVVRVSESILQDYQDAGGISRYDVRDETTNRDIDARAARFIYVIDPVTSIHQIYITGITTRSGADFEEVIQVRQQGNGVGSGVNS